MNETLVTSYFLCLWFQKLETGAVEIEVEDLNVLNPAIPQLPFSVADYQKVSLLYQWDR